MHGYNEPKKVKEICENLNAKCSLLGITFNSKDKNIGYIEGGTCTAMSFDLAKRILKDPLHLVSQVFQQKKKYTASSLKFRTLQSAFNCIEVADTMDFPHAEAHKMQAISTHFSMNSEPASSLISQEINDQEFAASIFSLKPGVYIARMVKRAENPKLEEHGHTMLLVKNEEEWFFMDPNHGLAPLYPQEESSVMLAAYFKHLFAKWDCQYFRLYQMSLQNI